MAQIISRAASPSPSSPPSASTPPPPSPTLLPYLLSSSPVALFSLFLTPSDFYLSTILASPPSGAADRPPTEMAPVFPGCDYEHWLIVMDKPGGGATKQEMIDCYIKTLAKVVGSEEEAKKKIYNVSCERYFGFGCEIDEETSNKLEGLPGVLSVLPDSYVDPEYKDYGAFDNVHVDLIGIMNKADFSWYDLTYYQKSIPRPMDHLVF
ncbi:hypothetical protein GOBAR_AA02348 [Gossypium barbadense]|uniref:MORF/ORRM1/DAG-like MORF domain-containing protein n=1 Tax=Gossypium barbadense TaxID=3634 RepID=A0A2P5YRJ7_GOSBA|nr:hypothetical protein GOBAR_AA02348 [Gossypium barbadense]